MGPTPEGTLHRSHSNESFTDNSSMSGQVDDSAVVAYYTANITAACEAANAPRPNDLSTEEELQLAKRRRSNRLSARRWRNRKKRNFTELRKQILELSKEQSELILEKSKLEQELKVELQKAVCTSVRLPPLAMSRGLSFHSRASHDVDMLLHSLLVRQSQGPPLPPTDAFLRAQGLGSHTTTFNAYGASQHNPRFLTNATASNPQPSSFLSSNEACAVSALLRGFKSEV